VRATTTHRHDYVSSYVDDLPAVINLAAIRGSGLRLAVDPLGAQPWRSSVAHHAVTVHVQRVGVEQVADAIARRQRRGKGDDPLLDVFA
jgi:phosphoglucomutase